MSQTFTDDDLLTWEAFASGGRFGLAVRARVVFHCISDRSLRPRFVQLAGDEAHAESAVFGTEAEGLRAMLRQARELD